MSREVMQQALDALERLTEKVSRTGFADSDAFTNALDTADLMRVALAQPEQDVDFWIRAATQARQAEMEMRREIDALKSQPEQKPVAWISKHGVVYPLDAKDEVHPINELQPLYTDSPAAQQPLTDDAIGELYVQWDAAPGATHADLIRMVEAKHGIGEKR